MAQYQKLPQDLQEAYFSVELDEVIIAIGKKYNLAMDKIGELASETGLVITGLTTINDFVPNLLQRLGVSKELATEIAQNVSEQVFAKVRESMKKVHSAHGGDQSLLEVKEAPQAEKKDDVLRHLDEDAEIENDLKATMVSKKTTETKQMTKEDFKVSDLIKVSLGVVTEKEKDYFPVSNLIKASLPPDNLPIGDIEKPTDTQNVPINRMAESKIDIPSSLPIPPIPKPPVKPNNISGIPLPTPNIVGITRMPKEESQVSTPKSKDPYREAVN